MRYHFPISVDMFDFLTTGRFDYLEIGQTAEMILQMFPAPECVPKGLLVKKGWNIWLYGNIELHFSDDRLTQIRAVFQPGFSIMQTSLICIRLLQNWYSTALTLSK